MRTSIFTRLACTFLVVVWGTAPAQGANADKAEDLSKFYIDISSGTVSAAGIIGLNKTAVQQVETSKDLLLAIQPMANGDVGSGIGFSVTPARTSILPMSARNYANSDVYRLLGSITFSAAQNTKDIGSVKYKQSGYSLDASYYWNDARDPIVAAHLSYDTCSKATDEGLKNDFLALQVKRLEGKLSPAELQAESDRLQGIQAKAYSACVKKAVAALSPTAWTATRFSLSVGSGSIKAPGGASAQSLGTLVTLNATWGLTDSSALNLSARSVRRAVDPNTLTGTPAFSHSSLVAVRYTLGAGGKDEESPVRALIEVSNAKARSPTVFKDVYLQAVGVDYKVAEGIWLEVRYGRNRTVLGDKTENSGMMTFNISPTGLSRLFGTKT